MIDQADLCILETMTDAMTPIERQCVEQVRELFDALEEAQEQLEKSVAPSALEEAEELAREAEENLKAAEKARDEARDLAEERSKQLDDLRSQLTHAERREDEQRASAMAAKFALKDILDAIQTKLESVTS